MDATALPPGDEETDSGRSVYRQSYYIQERSLYLVWTRIHDMAPSRWNRELGGQLLSRNNSILGKGDNSEIW